MHRFRFILALSIMLALFIAVGWGGREATKNAPDSVRFQALNHNKVTMDMPLAAHPQGCASDEIWVDAQDWWVNSDGGPGEDFGHLHTAFCWPYRKTLTAPYVVRIRQTLHQNPGVLERPYIQVEPGTDISSSGVPSSRTLANCTSTGGTVADSGKTCHWNSTITINPSGYSNGWKEIRVRGRVREPNGGEMVTTTGLQLCMKSCSSDSGYRSTSKYTETRGWYDNPFMGYANSGGYDFGKLLAPVSGTLTMNIWLKRGAEGVAVSGHYVALDTDFHNGNPGVVVKQGTGEFRGNITIDTTTLSNGWHRLFLRTDQFDSRTGTVHSGIFATMFEVQN